MEGENRMDTSEFCCKEEPRNGVIGEIRIKK